MKYIINKKLIIFILSYIFRKIFIILSKISNLIERIKFTYLSYVKYIEICTKYNIKKNTLFGINMNIKKIIYSIDNDELYEIFIVFEKKTKTMFLNVEVGGIPDKLHKNYLPPEGAIKYLREAAVRSIIFRYNDKWSLLPPPIFYSPQDLSSMVRFASEKPKEFLSFFSIKCTIIQ